jgi:Zn-dependent M16 (insulinase) family peptidase
VAARIGWAGIPSAQAKANQPSSPLQQEKSMAAFRLNVITESFFSPLKQRLLTENLPIANNTRQQGENTTPASLSHPAT